MKPGHKVIVTCCGYAAAFGRVSVTWACPGCRKVYEVGAGGEQAR